jgi:hypothetical protein
MRARLTAICIDTAAVVGFVALGRGSHAEGEAVAGVATVAAPFLIGLAVGWIAMRRTTLPAGRRTGTVVWACTTAIGLAVRGLAFGRPTPVVFMLVGGAFLALTLLGWRAAWGLIVRMRAREDGASEPSAP